MAGNSAQMRSYIPFSDKVPLADRCFRRCKLYGFLMFLFFFRGLEAKFDERNGFFYYFCISKGL